TKEIESHGSVTVLDSLNDVLEGERTCREIKVDGVDTDDVVDIISQSLEHEGCPYNYMPSKGTEVETKTIEMEREELRKKQAEDRIREEALAKEAAEIEARRSQEAERLSEVKEDEELLLEKHSRSLRHYLLENVMPTLKEGIVEACEKAPEDPVTFLAEDWFIRNGHGDELDKIKDVCKAARAAILGEYGTFGGLCDETYRISEAALKAAEDNDWDFDDSEYSFLLVRPKKKDDPTGAIVA
ncbi:hypothetical protein FOZ62_026376, partial [Perkinsus olseni]